MLAGGLLGCSTPGSKKFDLDAANARAFAAPTDLTARLADPINIDLKWKDNATNEAGYFVEYSPEANDDFVIVEALPPNTRKYRHPHLLPQTRFVYRVRPFFGPASNTAEVTTGKAGPQQRPTPDQETPPPDNTGPKNSLRSVATIAAAAPTGLKATLIPPAGVRLEWQDHAGDADGYLLEIKPQWESQFKVSSFLQPGTHWLLTYGFPPESKFTFRVRAFFYGQPSNHAEQTTGIDPTLGSGPWIRSDSPPEMKNAPATPP